MVLLVLSGMGKTTAVLMTLFSPSFLIFGLRIPEFGPRDSEALAMSFWLHCLKGSDTLRLGRWLWRMLEMVSGLCCMLTVPINFPGARMVLLLELWPLPCSNQRTLWLAHKSGAQAVTMRSQRLMTTQPMQSMLRRQQLQLPSG